MRRGILWAGIVVNLHVDLRDLARLAGIDELLGLLHGLALPPLKTDLHNAVGFLAASTIARPSRMS